jgi:hypothetical protein
MQSCTPPQGVAPGEVRPRTLSLFANDIQSGEWVIWDRWFHEGKTLGHRTPKSLSTYYFAVMFWPLICSVAIVDGYIAAPGR